MLFMTKAMSMANISYLAPYDFLRLPIVSILAFSMFNETPDFSTFVGAIIIFFSSFFMTNLASKNKN